MAKIIRFESARNKTETVSLRKNLTCEHKQVVAYTVHRTVCCSICGTELDSFDVLVDMLKAYVPPDAGKQKEKLLHGEIE